jgi:threonine dehydrogenase-like Zn-dependent dehydrogenase
MLSMAALAIISILTTLFAGGKERMRRLMRVIQCDRLNLGPLVTHRFKLDQLESAYELLADRRDGVLKVAITP